MTLRKGVYIGAGESLGEKSKSMAKFALSPAHPTVVVATAPGTTSPKSEAPCSCVIDAVS